MKTIQEFKDLLYTESVGNSLLGCHLNRLFGEKTSARSDIHNLEEKIEVVVQMNNNGINAFTDEYKLGSVSKAYYQLKLKEFVDFQ